MGRPSPLKRPSCSQEKAETSLRAGAMLVFFLLSVCRGVRIYHLTAQSVYLLVGIPQTVSANLEVSRSGYHVCGRNIITIDVMYSASGSCVIMIHALDGLIHFELSLFHCFILD